MEYLGGTDVGAAVRDRLDAAAVRFASPIVLAEVYSKVRRDRTEQEAEAAVRLIQSACAVVEHTAEIGVEAGRIHAEMKEEVPGFGMADAFVLAAARSREVTVLTGDPHFEGVEDAEML